MKRLLWGLFGLAMAGIFAGTAVAQRNPRGKAEVTVNGKTVSVEYGRPSLRGRAVGDMLSKLSAGESWRLGADQSTTFTSSGDVSFGDVKVPKGSYSLWLQKQADNSWKLVFNKQHGQWGTEHDASQDFASAPLTESKGTSPAEQVTINLAKAEDGAALVILWGDLKLSASFQ